MKRIPVGSSNVSSVGYDPVTSTLEIEFHGGRIYQYANGPTRHFVELTSGSGSVGGYFNRHVKNSYQYRRANRSSELFSSKD
jgi:hypothetical protein